MVVRVTDVAKRRRQGLVACRAALPFEGLLDARPGVAPAPPFGAVVRQSSIEAPVGELGLVLGAARSAARWLLVGADWRPAVTARQRRSAGEQFQPAGLLPCQRWARERVVLILGEQMPAEHDELASDRDRCDLRAAARADALAERLERSGASDRDPRGLDQHRAGLRIPAL